MGRGKWKGAMSRGLTGCLALAALLPPQATAQAPPLQDAAPAAVRVPIDVDALFRDATTNPRPVVIAPFPVGASEAMVSMVLAPGAPASYRVRRSPFRVGCASLAAPSVETTVAREAAADALIGEPTLVRLREATSAVASLRIKPVGPEGASTSDITVRVVVTRRAPELAAGGDLPIDVHAKDVKVHTQGGETRNFALRLTSSTARHLDLSVSGTLFEVIDGGRQEAATLSGNMQLEPCSTEAASISIKPDLSAGTYHAVVAVMEGAPDAPATGGAYRIVGLELRHRAWVGCVVILVAAGLLIRLVLSWLGSTPSDVRQARLDIAAVDQKLRAQHARLVRELSGSTKTFYETAFQRYSKKHGDLQKKVNAAKSVAAKRTAVRERASQLDQEVLRITQAVALVRAHLGLSEAFYDDTVLVPMVPTLPTLELNDYGVQLLRLRDIAFRLAQEKRRRDPDQRAIQGSALREGATQALMKRESERWEGLLKEWESLEHLHTHAHRSRQALYHDLLKDFVNEAPDLAGAMREAAMESVRVESEWMVAESDPSLAYGAAVRRILRSVLNESGLSGEARRRMWDHVRASGVTEAIASLKVLAQAPIQKENMSQAGSMTAGHEAAVSAPRRSRPPMADPVSAPSLIHLAAFDRWALRLTGGLQLLLGGLTALATGLAYWASDPTWGSVPDMLVMFLWAAGVGELTTRAVTIETVRKRVLGL